MKQADEHTAALVEQEDWAALDLPTPVELYRHLAIGERVDLRGHRLVPCAGGVRMINPFDRECGYWKVFKVEEARRVLCCVAVENCYELTPPSEYPKI